MDRFGGDNLVLTWYVAHKLEFSDGGRFRCRHNNVIHLNPSLDQPRFKSVSNSTAGNAGQLWSSGDGSVHLNLCAQQAPSHASLLRLTNPLNHDGSLRNASNTSHNADVVLLHVLIEVCSAHTQCGSECDHTGSCTAPTALRQRSTRYPISLKVSLARASETSDRVRARASGVAVVCVRGAFVHVAARYPIPAVACGTSTRETSVCVRARRAGVAVVRVLSAFVHVAARYPIPAVACGTSTRKTSDRVCALRVGVAVVRVLSAFVHVAACHSLVSAGPTSDAGTSKTSDRVRALRVDVAVAHVCIAPVDIRRIGAPCAETIGFALHALRVGSSYRAESPARSFAVFSHCRSSRADTLGAERCHQGSRSQQGCRRLAVQCHQRRRILRRIARRPASKTEVGNAAQQTLCKAKQKRFLPCSGSLQGTALPLHCRLCKRTLPGIRWSASLNSPDSSLRVQPGRAKPRPLLLNSRSWLDTEQPRPRLLDIEAGWAGHSLGSAFWTEGADRAGVESTRLQVIEVDTRVSSVIASEDVEHAAGCCHVLFVSRSRWRATRRRAQVRPCLRCWRVCVQIVAVSVVIASKDVDHAPGCCHAVACSRSWRRAARRRAQVSPRPRRCKVRVQIVAEVKPGIQASKDVDHAAGCCHAVSRSSTRRRAARRRAQVSPRPRRCRVRVQIVTATAAGNASEDVDHAAGCCHTVSVSSTRRRAARRRTQVSPRPRRCRVCKQIVAVTCGRRNTSDRASEDVDHTLRFCHGVAVSSTRPKAARRRAQVSPRPRCCRVRVKIVVESTAPAPIVVAASEDVDNAARCCHGVAVSRTRRRAARRRAQVRPNN
eukprot:1349470-Rhodomonas_salina.2